MYKLPRHLLGKNHQEKSRSEKMVKNHRVINCTTLFNCSEDAIIIKAICSLAYLHKDSKLIMRLEISFLLFIAIAHEKM